MKMLMQDQTLFKDIDVFDSSHVPEEFLYRDEQTKTLLTCIKPAIKGTKPSNALLLGKTATGKTTSARILTKEIRESTDKIIPVHINCQIYSTQYKIFSEIHKAVLGTLPPTSGLPLSEIFDKIFGTISKKKKTLLVILDDADLLFAKECLVIYDILRSHEVYDNVKTGLWCICHKNNMHLLDDKTRSTFNPTIINFNPYKHKEIIEILSNRISAGLYKGVFSDDLTEIIAEHSPDLRSAIENIKKSVLMAEAESKIAVSKQQVIKVLGLQTEQSTKDELEEAIISILQKQNMESGQLYERVKHIAKNYAKFYRKLNELKQKGRIEIKNISKEKGRTSIISIL